MGFTEFVILAAAMHALTALPMDAMLPALPAMGSDLQTINVNDVQLIVLTMMIGLALGHMFYSPLSDNISRKPPIYLGFAVYTAGTLFACPVRHSIGCPADASCRDWVSQGHAL